MEKFHKKVKGLTFNGSVYDLCCFGQYFLSMFLKLLILFLFLNGKIVHEYFPEVKNCKLKLRISAYWCHEGFFYHCDNFSKMAMYH